MNVKPLSDQCFVQLEGVFAGYSGPIVLPHSVQRKKSIVARVVRDTLPAKRQASFGGLKSVVNHRVILHPYGLTELPEIHKGANLYRIPAASILAILDDTVSIDVLATEGPSRCIHCGPAKSGSAGNVMLDAAGYCPRCLKNIAGDQRSD